MLKHFNSNRLQRNLLFSFQICGSLRTNATISGNQNYFQPTTQIEPFRIKVVQHIKFRTPEEREIALKVNFKFFHRLSCLFFIRIFFAKIIKKFKTNIF